MTQSEIEAASLLKKLGIQPPPPDGKWPAWARAIATRRLPSDAGLGDTAAHVLDTFDAHVLKRAYKVVFGADCGCGTRQQLLNEWYPEPRHLRHGRDAAEAVHNRAADHVFVLIADRDNRR